MEPLGWTTLALALLVIVSRAPLLVAPEAAVRVFRSLIAKPARIRLLGTIFVALGAALALTAPSAADSHPTASAGLTLLGWLLLVVSLWQLVWPRGYQFVVEGFLEAFTDMTVLRVIGAMGTGVGLALAWLAFELN